MTHENPSLYYRIRGVTFLEILLVIAIILIIGSVTGPFLTRFVLKNNFQTTTDKVISTIRKAQTYAMSGKNGVVWAICTQGSLIRLYRGGTCASPTFSEDFDIPAAITVSGLSNTTFSAGRGEPSQTLTIIVSSSLDSQQILLNAAGGLTIN